MKINYHSLRTTWAVALSASLILLVFAGCKTNKPAATAQAESQAVVVDEAVETVETETKGPYRASNTRYWDLVHTDLDVRFDWQKQRLMGKASLTLQPYFYDLDSLVLDAKGFDLKTVGMRKDGKITSLPFNYANDKITIRLPKAYKKSEKVEIWVDYTAKPEERESGGSEAITSAKGLYFINPLGTDTHKPRQIWTQGETESSSAWFPTIDSPNENHTQKIAITVEKGFKTLSNGLMLSSKDNGDGTRTDTWAQNKPHAPYLTMMAIGDFEVINDKWRNLAVDYYVEKPYAPYARNTFGNTPEMLEFYSKLLGFDYPWDKYSQIVVRDYVSGAMENTSAVIHGEFIHQTDRELLDGDYEDIIAHELFHHWFGDVVTCESWSNLPLNESFATYGEYLWREHKYGRASADEHGQSQLNQYLAESKQKQVDMIRFHYGDKEDMFDSHSYAKGGRILHMLRKTIGDSAFFQGLNLYLKTNQYKAVEMHQLRLAMEEVCGQDLNWFFNQWFYASGHPVLDIKTGYDSNSGEAWVTINQNQEVENTPVYRLPLAIDLYYLGQKHRKQVVADGIENTFRFKVPTQPNLINVDAEKMLLCVKSETKTDAEWAFQYKNGPLYLDRLEAMTNLVKKSDSLSASVVLLGLDDSHWAIRSKAVEGLKAATRFMPGKVSDKLASMVKYDPKAAVRAAAIDFLAKNFADSPLLPEAVESGLKDRSYNVCGTALNAIAKKDEPRAMALAAEMAADARGNLLSAIGGIYAKKGGPEHLDFFVNAYHRVGDPGQKYMFIQLFGRFVLKQDEATVLKALPTLREFALNEGAWWLRLSALQALSEMNMRFTNSQAVSKGIADIIEEVKQTEKDGKVRNFLGLE